MEKVKGYMGVRCRIKAAYEGAGREGELHALLDTGQRQWVVLTLDGDDDPELYKLVAVEMATATWGPVQ